MRHDSKQLSQDEMVLDEDRYHHLKFLTNQVSDETEQSHDFWEAVNIIAAEKFQVHILVLCESFIGSLNSNTMLSGAPAKNFIHKEQFHRCLC